jgi:hypothetical protein
MGIWGALTVQGKLVLAGAVVGLLLLFGLISGGGDRPGSDSSQAFVLPTLALSPTAARGPSTSPTSPATAAVSPASATSIAAASSSPPVSTPTPDTPPPTTVAAAQPTATRPAPTPTQPVVAVVPTEPPPPPPPPEPTQPPPGCVVSAIPSPSLPPGNDSVTGTLNCGGTPSSGAPMTAVFSYDLVSSGCSGTSGASGTASCAVSVGRETGSLRSVDVCFNAGGQRYCTSAGPP